MALDPTRKIIQIAVSAAPGNVPVGLEVGELGVDLANPPRLWVGCPPGIDVSELLRLPLGSYAPSVAWAEGTDPDGISIFVNNTGRTLAISAISGVVERKNGLPAEVSIVKAAPDTSLATGIDVHTSLVFDADGVEGETQPLVPALDNTLPPGWRLGLQASSQTGMWDDSVAVITVYLE